MMASPSAQKNSTATAAAAAAAATMRPPEQGLNCPRCDSPNTKFCYYNNYSLTQPRHFCKTCRRYWTKGGALRNVPVGGGCRKSKKSKSLSSTSSTPSSSSRLTGFDPIANFQFGLLPGGAGAFSTNQHLIGFNCPISGGAGIHDESTVAFGNNGANYHSSVATSIESLSSINQDLHWKLQQQRLAMLFGSGDHQAQQKVVHEVHHQGPLGKSQVEPMCFQLGAESSKGEICGPKSSCFADQNDTTTAPNWFFEGGSYNMVNTTGAHNIVNNNSSSNNNSSGSNNNTSDQWNGIATWSDMQQFNALP